MKNKYPGTCLCGTRVAKGRGVLDLVDDRWIVRCPKCLADPAPAVKQVKATTVRRRRAVKAVKPRRKSVSPRRAAQGTRKRASKRGGKAWNGRMAASMTTDIVLTSNDIRHSAWVELGGGMRLPCSVAYARVHADRRQAAAAGDDSKDFDLSVALAELSIYGHTGIPEAAEILLAA